MEGGKQNLRTSFVAKNRKQGDQTKNGLVNQCGETATQSQEMIARWKCKHELVVD